MPATYKDNGGSVNGSNKVFTYDFPTLQTEDVKVALNGVTQATTKYTVSLSPANITFNNNSVDSSVQESDGSPKSGVTVRVYRETTVGKATGDEDPKAVFAAGSSIRASDLNANVEQALFGIHEQQEQQVQTESIADEAVTTAKIAADSITNAKIADNSINSEHYVDGSIDTAHLADNSVTSAKLVAGTVASSDLADLGVTTAKIANDAITAAKIADSQVTTAQIADDAVTSAKIPNNAIGASELDDNAVDTAAIQAGAITTAKILDSNVTTIKIADANVTTAKIAADAVTGAKIADDAVDSEHLAADSIDAEHYAPGSVDTTALGADSVTAAKIADDVINTEHYAPSSINNAAIGNNAVNSDQIADNAITAAELSTNCIAEANLQDNCVTSAQIAANSVASTNIIDGTIATGDIADNAVTSAKIAANAVTTSEIADAELTTLAGMQSGTASKLASGTALTADIADLNQIDGLTKQTTISDSDASFPTSGAVVDYVAAQIAPIGGLEVIATEVAFPNTQPQAGVVISIADAGGIVVNGSGVSTTGRTVGGSTVTINGINSAYNSSTVTAGVGFLVSSTGSGQIYNFHKSVIRDQDILSISTDINDFANRYRVGSSNPTSSLDDGDMFFNTSTGKMMVYNATSSAWEEVQSIGNFYINTISSYSGTGGNNATFNGSAYRFVLSDAPTNAEQLLVSINGVVQKPNSGTSQPSEGFAIDGSSIIFSSAPPTGSDYFIITIGSTVNIGTPSNNTVSTAILQNGSVTTDKLGADAVTGAKIADDAVGAEHIEVLDANLDFADDAKARFGTSDDLEIYHNGTNSKIHNDTGSLLIETDGSEVEINKGTSENLAKFIPDGAVSLYYDNSVKLATSADGTSLTGNATVAGTVGPSANATYNLGYNSQRWNDIYMKNDMFINEAGRICWGDGNELQIYHNGVSSYLDNNKNHLYLRNNVDGDDGGNIYLQAKSGEQSIICSDDQGVGLYFDNALKFETTSSGASVYGSLYCSDHLNLTNDNKKINLGDSSDLQIYHDGSNSYISDTGTGGLGVTSNHFWVADAANGEYLINAVENGAVQLYYDNSKKLETTANGVTISGRVDVQSLFTGDAYKILCGDQDDLQMYHNGSHAHLKNATGDFYIAGDTVKIVNGAINEDMIVCTANGSVSLRYNNSQKLETLSNGVGFDGDSSSCALRFKSDGSIRGYFYADAVSSTGHLDNSGAWKFRVENDGDYQFYGSSISDRDKKDNITTVTGTSLDKLTKLVPKTYKWKNLDGITPTDKTFTGFIAQEVKEHLPSLVTGTDGQKNMAVDYNGILAYAVKAITELSAEVETLKTKVAALEAK